jgi:D-glycero-D-manno-heptose 1,7-bisphosphate phosphatase
VLIENKPDYVRDWSHVRIIPEAIHALALPQLGHYKLVIITNQSAVGRGLIRLEAAEQINRQLIALIHELGGRAQAVYMCPHKPEDGCTCRKPNPGLLLQAAKDLTLDLRRSWMIGDAWSDVRAGQAAGVRHTILLKTGRGQEQLSQADPSVLRGTLIFDTLPLALNTIFTLDEIAS